MPGCAAGAARFLDGLSDGGAARFAAGSLAGAASFAAGSSAASSVATGWVDGVLVLASGLGAAASPLSSLRGVSVFAGGAASGRAVLGSVSGESGDSVLVDGVEVAGLGAKKPRSDSWPAPCLDMVFFGAAAALVDIPVCLSAAGMGGRLPGR